MTAPVDRAKLGKANREKGARRERELVNWLRLNGFPGAERGVRTGYRTAKRTSQDAGDITGLVGLAVQCTDRDDIDQDVVLTRRLAQTEQQRGASNADYGLLVTVRRGASTPGDWWCWLSLTGLLDLAADQYYPTGRFPLAAPVRLRLDDVVELLRWRGYGDPVVTE